MQKRFCFKLPCVNSNRCSEFGTKLHIDLLGFMNPSTIASNSFRPDRLLAIAKKCFNILELTVGFECNLQVHSNRKYQRYHYLIKAQKSKFVNFVVRQFSKNSAIKMLRMWLSGIKHVKVFWVKPTPPPKKFLLQVNFSELSHT